MEAGGATREARRARAERCGAAREPERCVRRSAAARKAERGTRGARGPGLRRLRPPPPGEVVTGNQRHVLRWIWPQGPWIQWWIEGGGASSFSQRATAFFHGGWARPLLLQASDDASSDGSGLGARGSVVAADLAMSVEVQRRGGAGTAMQRRMGSTPGLDGLALGSLFFFCFFYVYRGGQLGSVTVNLDLP